MLKIFCHLIPQSKDKFLANFLAVNVVAFCVLRLFATFVGGKRLKLEIVFGCRGNYLVFGVQVTEKSRVHAVHTALH